MYKNIFKNLQIIKEIHNQLLIKHLILPAHIILSLYYIYSNDSGSRYAITDTLAIPISRVRKILDLLEKYNLLEKNLGRKGTILTQEGNRFCESIFSCLKIANPDELKDVGPIVLGKINSLTIMPRDFFTKKIKSISIRDSSLKCGAIGASIFEAKFNEKGDLNINFLEGEKIESKILTESIRELIDSNKNQLMIVSTGNELTKFFFSPLFDNKKVDALKVVLLASTQSMWELIEQELE